MSDSSYPWKRMPENQRESISSIIHELIEALHEALEKAEERERKGLVSVSLEMPKWMYEALKAKAKGRKLEPFILTILRENL